MINCSKNDYSDDEHQLIAAYCQSLNGSSSGVGGNTDNEPPRSPGQVMTIIHQEQREELEAMIRYDSKFISN